MLYLAIFWGAGFSTSAVRRKTVVQLGSLGGEWDWGCKPSPVGFKLKINNSKQWWKLTLETNTFESSGVLVWDPKLIYQLQNSTGYSTELCVLTYKKKMQVITFPQFFPFNCPVIKTTGWVQGRLSLLSFQGR